MAVLTDRPQVKAFVFGHTHTWKLAGEGRHPPHQPSRHRLSVREGRSDGLVDAQFTETGVKLEVQAIDRKHTKHGDKAELTWRKR